MYINKVFVSLESKKYFYILRNWLDIEKTEINVQTDF